MHSDEVDAAGALLGGALGGTVSLIHELHGAIASRPFGVLGPAAKPARVIHDGASAGAYMTLGAVLGGVPRLAGALIAGMRRPDAPSLSDTRGGAFALSALNGVIGDTLAADQSPFALSMSLRSDGEDVAPEPQALARAHPNATSRVVIFVHGLCETDESWRLRPLSSEPWPRPSYGSRLHGDLGYTPLHLRYNTGLHISDNGRELAELLQRVVEAWPARVDEIVLVGHSMGGLVARSACHYADAEGAGWARRVRHVFCLGSPHLGAPLEKAANIAGHALARVRETAPVATVLNGRSVGIKDLRFGSLVEEDWRDCDPDEFLNDRCCEVPFLDGATYYFVGATLSRDPQGPLGSIAGDLLVRYSSASGRGRRRRVPFEIDKGRHLGGVNHFQLLNHPTVYEQIHAWLSGTEARALSGA